MDFRKLNDNDLAALAANIVALLGGTELTAIDINVRTDLIAAFGTLPATLTNQADAASIAEDVTRAAIADRNDTMLKIQTLVAQTRDALKAGLAPAGQYRLCGLSYPAKPRSTYIAQDPTGLSGAGTSNGVNRLRFNGNNVNGMVVYEIYRRQGDEGPWGFLAAIKAQRYADMPVTPGQYYEYKVRAVAAKSKSAYSNSAVVYGAS